MHKRRRFRTGCPARVSKVALHSEVIPTRQAVSISALDISVHAAALDGIWHALVVKVPAAQRGGPRGAADRGVCVIIVQHHTVLRNVLHKERHTAHIAQKIRLVVRVQVDDIQLLRSGPGRRRCRRCGWRWCGWRGRRRWWSWAAGPLDMTSAAAGIEADIRAGAEATMPDLGCGVVHPIA
jgi:hypothetical protein